MITKLAATIPLESSKTTEKNAVLIMHVADAKALKKQVNDAADSFKNAMNKLKNAMKRKDRDAGKYWKKIARNKHKELDALMERVIELKKSKLKAATIPLKKHRNVKLKTSYTKPVLKTAGTYFYVQPVRLTVKELKGEIDVNRFIFATEKSKKFWEIWTVGATVHVRWGRIGAAGSGKSFKLANRAAATKFMVKAIQTKQRKGYKGAEVELHDEDQGFYDRLDGGEVGKAIGHVRESLVWAIIEGSHEVAAKTAYKPNEHYLIVSTAQYKRFLAGIEKKLTSVEKDLKQGKVPYDADFYRTWMTDVPKDTPEWHIDQAEQTVKYMRELMPELKKPLRNKRVLSYCIALG